MEAIVAGTVSEAPDGEHSPFTKVFITGQTKQHK